MVNLKQSAGLRVVVHRNHAAMSNSSLFPKHSPWTGIAIQIQIGREELSAKTVHDCDDYIVLVVTKMCSATPPTGTQTQNIREPQKVRVLARVLRRWCSCRVRFSNWKFISSDRNCATANRRPRHIFRLSDLSAVCAAQNLCDVGLFGRPVRMFSGPRLAGRPKVQTAVIGRRTRTASRVRRGPTVKTSTIATTAGAPSARRRGGRGGEPKYTRANASRRARRNAVSSGGCRRVLRAAYRSRVVPEDPRGRRRPCRVRSVSRCPRGRRKTSRCLRRSVRAPAVNLDHFRSTRF